VSRTWEGESDNPLDWGRYEAAKRSTLRGKRGQAFLRELVAALDALPQPELSEGALGDRRTGCVCALGAVALAQGGRLPTWPKMMATGAQVKPPSGIPFPQHWPTRSSAQTTTGAMAMTPAPANYVGGTSEPGRFTI